MKATLHWIEGPWRGRLAIMPRPRGGDWLEDEMRSWRVEGVDTVLCLLTEEEIEELELSGEADGCAATGIEFQTFPIEDRGVPVSTKSLLDLVHNLESKLADAKNVVVHCRQGVGRSALLAACILATSGLDVDTAFKRIEAARGAKVPDTEEQKQWVVRLSRAHLTAPAKK